MPAIDEQPAAHPEDQPRCSRETGLTHSQANVPVTAVPEYRRAANQDQAGVRASGHPAGLDAERRRDQAAASVTHIHRGTQLQNSRPPNSSR